MLDINYVFNVSPVIRSVENLFMKTETSEVPVIEIGM